MHFYHLSLTFILTTKSSPIASLSSVNAVHVTTRVVFILVLSVSFLKLLHGCTFPSEQRHQPLIQPQALYTLTSDYPPNFTVSCLALLRILISLGFFYFFKTSSPGQLQVHINAIPTSTRLMIVQPNIF